jgi:ABC-2 type transport system permease protein
VAESTSGHSARYSRYSRYPRYGRVEEALRAYRLIAGMWLRASLAYRASFWITTVGNGVTSLLDFVVIAVMFQHTTVLGGWTLPQVAFLYGT